MRMIVEEVMSRDAITLSPQDKIESALKLLNEHRIRHIPITNDEEQVVGIVSDRDIRDAAPSILAAEQNLDILESPIQSIMSSPVITAHPLDFIEDIASLFYDYEIACVPVTHANKLIGVVTEKDILYTLIQVTGIREQSSQIEIRVPNKIGTLPKIAQIISERNTNISSVFLYPSKEDRSERIIVLRVQTMNPMPIIDELRKQGYHVIWPNLPGMSE